MPRPRKRRYLVENRDKYRGSIDRITTRSSWEWAVCRFLDQNANVRWWSSEETVIQYVCGTDGRVHRYYVDFTICLMNGSVLLVEVKPKSQTEQPIPPRTKRQSQHITYRNAMEAYIKNLSKWDAAVKFAASKGWKFQIWTEVKLQEIGIRIVGRSSDRRLNS